MDASKLIDKISKRQIIAIVSMYFVTQPDRSIDQIVACCLIASLTIASYTALTWKHGPDKVNGRSPDK